MPWSNYTDRCAGRVIQFIYHYCGLHIAERVQVCNGDVSLQCRPFATYVWQDFEILPNVPHFEFLNPEYQRIQELKCVDIIEAEAKRRKLINKPLVSMHSIITCPVCSKQYTYDLNRKSYHTAVDAVSYSGGKIIVYICHDDLAVIATEITNHNGSLMFTPDSTLKTLTVPVFTPNCTGL